MFNHRRLQNYSFYASPIKSNSLLRISRKLAVIFVTVYFKGARVEKQIILIVRLPQFYLFQFYTGGKLEPKIWFWDFASRSLSVKMRYFKIILKFLRGFRTYAADFNQIIDLFPCFFSPSFYNGGCNFGVHLRNEEKLVNGG